MAKRPTLTDVTSLTNSSNINAINQNWDAIQEAFDNTLSLDGSTPNAMNSDLDLNGNSLLNVDTLDVDGLTLNGQTVTGLATVPEWRSAWASGQSYVVNDLVKTAGNVYICLVAHTAGVNFSTDLTAGNWELLVSKGDSGAGTGDMLSTNNLSDVANPATSRTNLGLGTVAVENTVPVAKGGTGATDATTARTNLSAQTLNANLTSLSGITLVQGDLLYATGPDTLVRLPKGTANQILKINSGATAPEWGTNLSETSVISLSGSTTDISTSIPAGVTRITVWVTGLSLSGSGYPILQVGTGGSFVTTGYKRAGSSHEGASVGSTSGFPSMASNNSNPAATNTGSVRFDLRLINPATNTWQCSHVGSGASNATESGTLGHSGGGDITLAGPLDRLRMAVTTASTYDAGTVFAEWEF